MNTPSQNTGISTELPNQTILKQLEQLEQCLENCIYRYLCRIICHKKLEAFTIAEEIVSSCGTYSAVLFERAQRMTASQYDTTYRYASHCSADCRGLKRTDKRYTG